MGLRVNICTDHSRSPTNTWAKPITYVALTIPSRSANSLSRANIVSR